MKRLTIRTMGDKVQGVRLLGDRRNPEPESFRVVLPFGDVDIVRCTDDSYWVHFRVNRPEDGFQNPEDCTPGRVVDARVDKHGKHAAETLDLAEPLNDPAVYHIAVRLAPEGEEEA